MWTLLSEQSGFYTGLWNSKSYLTFIHWLISKTTSYYYWAFFFLVNAWGSLRWHKESVCRRFNDDTFIPDVACVRGCKSVDVQTEVGHGEVEHKEVTGSPHLLHCEEGHDADGVEEESQHPCSKKREKRNVPLIISITPISPFLRDLSNYNNHVLVYV